MDETDNLNLINMELPKYEQLDTLHLQRLFDNMSECYKLFWFQAIVEHVHENQLIISFDELINDMIADAWYMVTEYRLNLGPVDNLEALVHYAQGMFGLKSSAKKSEILDAISSSTDRELIKKKQILTYNVPYRLQAPFLHSIKGQQGWSGSQADLANRINSHDGLIYHFTSIAGLSSVITVDEQWAEYIRKNYDIIMGWIQFNLIQYLQRRNPSVPGIPNKLAPPQERQLQKVKNYWKTILTIEPLHEIYAGQELDGSSISIDHFIPWSYVAHDELWNLHPTTRSINSSKSNHLPDWDLYYAKLRDMEYHAYSLMWKNEHVHAEFDKCAKDHINSADVMHKLYRPELSKEVFGNHLEEIIRPVYNAAINLGFDRWAV